jgi:hypothetical protein
MANVISGHMLQADMVADTTSAAQAERASSVIEKNGIDPVRTRTTN